MAFRFEMIFYGTLIWMFNDLFTVITSTVSCFRFSMDRIEVSYKAAQYFDQSIKSRNDCAVGIRGKAPLPK